MAIDDIIIRLFATAMLLHIVLLLYQNYKYHSCEGDKEMAKLNCNDCIHNEVCYRRENVNTEYANNCGNYIDVNMIVDEIKKADAKVKKDISIDRYLIRKVMEDKNETD